MSARATSSIANQGPFDGSNSLGKTQAATDDDFGVILFAGGAVGVETNHAVDAVPSHWQGREVGLIAKGGNCYFAFSKRQGAEVDRAVAATAAGVSAKVGLPLPDSFGTETRARIPRGGGETIYFVRESDAVGTKVWMRLLA